MAQRTRIRRKTRRGRPPVRRAPPATTTAMRAEAKQGMTAASGLTIGGVQDPAEKAADRMADRVMRMREPVIHRKCAECEAEEKEAKRAVKEPEEDKQVQAKTAPKTAPVAPGGAAAPASPHAAKAIGALDGGRPMASAERAFFEPRMGADLSGVRVHDGRAADSASKAINARAFTLGSDIAFARGEYQPGTDSGRRLMAHELAHVVGDGRSVRRKPEIQKTDHPTRADFLKVPDKEIPRIEAALKIIEKVSKDAKCKSYFKDKCSGGKEDELQQAIDNAKIYKIAGSGLQFGSSVTRNDPADTRVVAYTPYVHRIGRWQLAASLLHEMFHTCIIGSIANEEVVDEEGIQTCGFFTPWIHRVNPASAAVGDEINVEVHRVGSGPDANHKLFLGGTEITKFEKWEFAGAGLDVNFKVPAGATTGDLFFVNHKVESNRVKFTVTP